MRPVGPTDCAERRKPLPRKLGEGLATSRGTPQKAEAETRPRWPVRVKGALPAIPRSVRSNARAAGPLSSARTLSGSTHPDIGHWALPHASMTCCWRRQGRRRSRSREPQPPRPRLHHRECLSQPPHPSPGHSSRAGSRSSRADIHKGPRLTITGPRTTPPRTPKRRPWASACSGTKAVSIKAEAARSELVSSHGLRSHRPTPISTRLMATIGQGWPTRARKRSPLTYGEQSVLKSPQPPCARCARGYI